MNTELYDNKLIEDVVTRYLGGSEADVFTPSGRSDGGNISVDVLGDIAIAEITSLSADHSWLNSDLALVKIHGSWQVISGATH